MSAHIMKEKYHLFDGDIELVDREYENLLSENYCKVKRSDLVRAFTNGKPLLDRETAEKLGRREMINFMSLYHNLNRVVTSYRSMVTSTDDLVNIIVDTGNPLQDRLFGSEMSEAINRGLIYRKQSFTRFWDEICDEVVISGGVPVIHSRNSSHIPDIERRMLFPDNADLDIENLSYCFRPVELTIRDLVNFQNATTDDKSKESIDKLINKIKEQLKSDDKTSDNSFKIELGSIRKDDSFTGSKETVDCYWFYEVKYDNDTPYVSASLISRKSDNSDLESRDSNSCIELVYVDKAFETLEDWITFIVVDSEIGGDGKINSLRGIAEMIYPSALKKEQLLNLLIEGDEIRALPKFILPDGMQPDDVLQLDLTRDTFYPKIEELRMNSSSNHLMTPIAMLDGTAGSFATGAGGSSTGDKLPEIKQRIAQQGIMEMAKADEMRRNLQNIIEGIVYNALTRNIKPKMKGYQQIMWVREFLKARGIPYKKLAERKHGRFIYLEVKVRKTLGANGLDEQQRIAQYFQDTATLRPPQQRANILYEMDLMITGDPDRARIYSGMSQETDNIIVAQRHIAGQEWNKIQMLAPLGEEQFLEGNDSDVHQDHLPEHIETLEGAIALGQYRKIDIVHINAIKILIKHINEAHMMPMSQNPTGAAEANAYRPRINNAINAFGQMIQQQEVEGIGSPEEIDAQMAKLALEERKVAIKEAEFNYKVGIKDPELFEDRRRRDIRANRGQEFNEAATAASLRLQERKQNEGKEEI